jgi:uncharacterized protein (TIGR00725 family)
MAIKVGVMGGASDVERPVHLAKAHSLGRAIGENGCILITGACPGLPLAAACGAKQAGGMVIGISPAQGLAEHIEKYQSPTEFQDVLIFTGSGLMGREVINIRSSDVVVIVGGRSGTLGELAIAYDEGKLIGVLTGMGGVGDMAAQILAVCEKNTGAQVVYEADPDRLIRKLLRLHAASAMATTGEPSESGKVDRTRARVKDPVCGMWILPRAAVARRTRGGQRFSFCSAECATRFDTAPEAYVPTRQRSVKRPGGAKGGKR